LSSESAKGFNVSTSDIAAILFHADCLLDERCRIVERLGRFTTSLTAGASADGSNGLGMKPTPDIARSPLVVVTDMSASRNA
jgi:hypothetical protein